jgi:glycosyltransferase involved in cell wall biosynthesis
VSPHSLRIAMVIQSYRPVLGGAERQLEQLAPSLTARGADVLVVTRRRARTAHREVGPGGRVWRTPTPPGRLGAALGATVAGTAAVLAFRPDVVHVHDLLSPGLIGLAVTSATGVPVVAKPLSAGPEGDVARLLSKPLGRARLRAMGQRFAAFVCVSEAIEQELAEHGVAWPRRVRIPNGVDTDRFRPAAPGEAEAVRARIGVPVGVPLLLSCGRLTQPKRLDVLVGALRGTAAHLLVVGEGPAAGSSQRAAVAAGVAGRFHLLPAVDDPAPLYRAADVYVSASEQDGLSNAALEAMASGLPLVVAHAGGMPELVRGDAGQLVADRTADAFACAIERLLSDAGSRSDAGQRARRRVLHDFSLTATVSLLWDLYNEVGARAR